MKRVLLSGVPGAYLLLVVGFALHTSEDPRILGRYSLPYAAALLLMLGAFPLVTAAWRWLLSTTTARLASGRTLVVTPLHKIVFYGFLLVAGLAAAEATLRIVRAGQPSFLDSYDPYLQNRLRAGDEALHVDGQGFRGEEIALRKPPGTFRIFVLGGSTVLCDRVPYESSHVRQLAKLLAQRYPDRDIEVLNAGNHWHTTEHSLIKYLFTIKDYDPDLVILWHGINDLYRSFTPADWAHGPYRGDYGHFYGPVSHIVFEHGPDGPPLIAVHSLVAGRIASAFRHNFATDLRRRPHDRPVTVTDFPSLAAFRRNLGSIATVLAADGVPLVLATQPYLYRDDLDADELARIEFPELFCEMERHRCPDIPSMIRGMEAFNAATAEVAREHDVPLIDLAAQVPRTTEYFLDDVHYTEAGNAAVARTIADFLVANGLVTGPQPRGPSTVRTATRRR